MHRLRNELEKESRERRSELQRMERRLMQKEESLDRKNVNIEKKEEELKKKEEENNMVRDRLSDLYQQQQALLEQISGMTSDEAKEQLLQLSLIHI